MGEGSGRHQFFERCPAPAAIVGFDGTVEDANDAWRDPTGWRAEELVGRPLAELLHPDDVGPCLGGAEAMASGALAGAWEGRLVRRDGSAVWLGWEVRASRRQRRYFCIARPLAQEEVRRQERFKVDFINMAAHEFNTPLTPIQLGLDTLAMRLDPVLGRDAQQSVEMLRRNFRRLQDLVTELLDSARLHAGRLPLELRETDLSALALQAAEAKREAAAEGHVALRLRVEPDLRARADAGRLLQVLDTYLSCALACAPPGGEVRLDLERGGGQALVSVACRGASLPSAQRERLFLPFPPEGESAAPRVGSGLGLYMARGIVERHGGRVGVHEGDGLVLSFSLPLEEAAAPAVALGRAEAGRTAAP